MAREMTAAKAGKMSSRAGMATPPLDAAATAAAPAEDLPLTPRPKQPVAEEAPSNEDLPPTTALALRDEVIWSDSDDDNGDGSVLLFPDAQDLVEKPGSTLNLIRLGTTQKLDESDSSEDEATLNRVGDIPLEWYKDEAHFGYDVEGRKLMKSERSALERLLEATDDPNALRTIYDALHDENKKLSNADLQMIFNLQRNRTPNANYNMYADVVTDSVEFDPLNHPLARAGGPSKKKFVPAQHDMKVIEKMVRRMMKAEGNKTDEKEEALPDESLVVWDDSKVEMEAHAKFKYQNRVPKPKVPPPGTYESYRPPPEYLPSDKARQRFARLRQIDRKEYFLPQAFDALRHVPFYHHTIQDRYQRCLDLALFPRAQRTRLVVDPSKLLPELPDPKDLRPYPERLSFQYKGHTATVRSVSVSPNGQFLATGCDDHLVRVYEVMTGRLMKRYDMGGPVQQVEFCPVKALNILAVAVEYSLVFIVPTFAAHQVVNEHTIRYLRAPGSALRQSTENHILGGEASLGGGGITQTTLDKDESAHRLLHDLHDMEEREKRAEFVDASAQERSAGIVVKIALHGKVKRFTFHARGDYLCALCPKDHVKYRQTVMLQLSKRKVFCPFRKFSEIVTDCKFHPREPLFFLATTNSVRVYNLMAHRLQRRYKAPGGITTCLSVHTEGDNFLVGDTTSHTQWYDCDFSDKPYKRMRSHKGVVNAVAFHTNTNAYPLFASGASDGQVHVFHGMVYDDYNKNPLLVPVKILKHRRGVYAIAWHPILPWVFTATEDGIVSAWTE
ncbi:ribosome biogenesis protein ERB1 [Trypanosoma rangeli]|uniref:Ribosome biogenesis protein BOP1 homolog n=1 Tax=Trypanosoma rangeli TaxID=5698 RepID=A0A422NYV3_TRYRA|nr:ribosome biogenesis protein ERB1 [Trypanosoma rangeli]RNF10615.1 ribosome biogenesis protein ERB1 [Trypanosoma rangeli]|eukprot:RNF10615.1 ribosome biogenesis protein ERB1 [Trypanosoma rangeli]